MLVFQRNLPNFPKKIHLHFWRPQRTPTAPPPSPLFYLFHTSQLTSVILTKLLSEQQNFFANFRHILKDSRIPGISKICSFILNFKIKCWFLKEIYRMFRKKSIFILGSPTASSQHPHRAPTVSPTFSSIPYFGFFILFNLLL